MSRIISKCPSCGGHQVKVAKIECTDCQTRFEGSFEIPALLRLSEDELRFSLAFIKCSGSLKEMATLENVSYPTMRNRLNDLIAKIETLEKNPERAKDEILSLLEAGKITAAEAALRLRTI